MRIEAVARDLEELAGELRDAVGPDAERALMHWRGELLEALSELRRTVAQSADDAR